MTKIVNHNLVCLLRGHQVCCDGEDCEWLPLHERKIKGGYGVRIVASHCGRCGSTL